MTQASLRELIVQERAAGKHDTDTLVLLRRSKLKPPAGYYCWSIPALRAVMDEDPSGYRADGRRGSAVFR